MRKPNKIEMDLTRLLQTPWRDAAKDRRGIAAVEFAMLVPILVLLAICTADLGLAIYANMRVEDSAEAGSAYAALHGFNASAITSAVTNAGDLSGLSATPAPTSFCGCPGSNGITSIACGSNCPNGNLAGTYVSASASATYHTILHYPIIPAQYNFASTSTVRIK